MLWGYSFLVLIICCSVIHEQRTACMYQDTHLHDVKLEIGLSGGHLGTTQLFMLANAIKDKLLSIKEKITFKSLFLILLSWTEQTL